MVESYIAIAVPTTCQHNLFVGNAYKLHIGKNDLYETNIKVIALLRRGQDAIPLPGVINSLLYTCCRGDLRPAIYKTLAHLAASSRLIHLDAAISHAPRTWFFQAGYDDIGAKTSWRHDLLGKSITRHHSQQKHHPQCACVRFEFELIYTTKASLQLIQALLLIPNA